MRRRHGRRAIAFLLLGCLVWLAGCDSIPTNGPSIAEVKAESQAARQHGFALITVDPGVLAAMARAPRRSLRNFFPENRPIVPKIGPGDVLSISIYESGIGELFAPPSPQESTYGTARVTLPNVTVGRDGNIAVPFAGVIKVAGLMPSQVRAAIARRLRGRAVKPQVLVSVVSDVTNIVTVMGAVKKPGRYPLTPASETLLQLIAMAGGPTESPGKIVLQVTRGNRQVSVPLIDLMRRPQRDIHAHPGDYIDLAVAGPTILVYGAVRQSGIYSIATGGMSLAKAIARAGGLQDSQADSRGVMIFREEYPQVLHDMPRGQMLAPPPPEADPHAMVPVIYETDLKTATGIFEATRLRLRNRDLVFVPTAPTVNWQKILDLFRMTATPFTTGVTSGVEMNRAF